MPLIRAAGGIVVRPGPEVLLVHRPRYDDWGFPKGKVEEGESDEQCALREVEEEACIRCRLGPYLGETRYEVLAGPKRVAFFRMETDDEPRPGDKVDEVRWTALEDADALLTWERDRDLLHEVAARL